MKTLRDLRRYLTQQATILSGYVRYGPPIEFGEGSEGEFYLDCTEIVETCRREAAMLGCDMGQEEAIVSPREALAMVGKLLAWARDNKPSDVLTVNQAAERLGVCAQTVYALIEKGRLRCQRIGVGRGTIRIRPQDLAGCLAEPEPVTFRHLTIRA
jgi:excisionase family DNA binding protein